jgi:DNA ligase (NAD+)
MKIQIPQTCPSCSSPLERVTDQLFCRNSECGAKINKRLEHFAKTLGIKGLGAKTIEKLDLADLTDIFYLDKDEAIAALGSEKIVDKLLNEIERAKLASLATVISSMSIPLIGGTAGTKIAGIVRNIDEITLDLCKKAGLGDKAAANLMDWIEIEYAEMKEFLPFTFDAPSTTPVSTNGQTICITGKLGSYKTKSEATTILIGLGFKVVESVSKTLNYLVDEDNKHSSKRQKADEYGIHIITSLKDFIKVYTND